MYYITQKTKEIRSWNKLVEASKVRSLESGLFQIVDRVLQQLSTRGILNRQDAYEYLANSRDGWGSDDVLEKDETKAYPLEKLDTTILALIEDLDADSDDLLNLLEEALHGSLWARSISRINTDLKYKYRMILESRARLIWTYTSIRQRQSHFSLNVGLEAGLILDEIMDNLDMLLVEADIAATTNRDWEYFCETLIKFCRNNS